MHGEVRNDVKRINLALQGGGAHGAFTWGVLDRLLEEERLSYDGISGTSAGAMNAVVFAEGWETGGREGARVALDRFWRAIADAGRYSPLRMLPVERFFGGWGYDRSASFVMFDIFSRLFSPYQVNPFNVNPLRDVLEKRIDFERIRGCGKIRLFISTTNVLSGKSRVFETGEITLEVILASACLPFLFQAIEIGDQSYWDGGFLGNPALYPLIYDCGARAVVIVQINPLAIEEVPKTSAEILDRMNEISFNASLIGEMRAIDFVARQLDNDRLDSNRYKHMLLHMIDSEAEMRRFGYASKLTADLDFLLHLKGIGRRAADRWLESNFDAIGVRATIDRDRFLQPEKRFGQHAAAIATTDLKAGE